MEIDLEEIMQILVPKRVPTETSPLPLFFVGGPVLGGGDWQADMCRMLDRTMQGNLLADGDFIAAIPCRWDATHPLFPHFLIGDLFVGRQTSWERMLLKKAAEDNRPGCAIFYLATQVEPRPPEMGVYARDTLGEIGEWRGRMMNNPHLRVVVGADPNFDPNGISVMERNFSDALDYSFPIHYGMINTARAAVEKMTTATVPT